MERQRLRYEKAERVVGLGLAEIEVINSDLSCSGRDGFTFTRGIRASTQFGSSGDVGIFVNRESAGMFVCKLFQAG
jgi:hypothetical protein